MTATAVLVMAGLSAFGVTLSSCSATTTTVYGPSPPLPLEWPASVVQVIRRFPAPPDFGEWPAKVVLVDGPVSQRLHAAALVHTTGTSPGESHSSVGPRWNDEKRKARKEKKIRGGKGDRNGMMTEDTRRKADDGTCEWVMKNGRRLRKNPLSLGSEVVVNVDGGVRGVRTSDSSSPPAAPPSPPAAPPAPVPVTAAAKTPTEPTGQPDRTIVYVCFVACAVFVAIAFVTDFEVFCWDHRRRRPPSAPPTPVVPPPLPQLLRSAARAPAKSEGKMMRPLYDVV